MGGWVDILQRILGNYKLNKLFFSSDNELPQAMKNSFYFEKSLSLFFTLGRTFSDAFSIILSIVRTEQKGNLGCVRQDLKVGLVPFFGRFLLDTYCKPHLSNLAHQPESSVISKCWTLNDAQQHIF